MCVGRIAPEKNLEAFLSLDLPGSKVVIGHGPQEAELRARFPGARFLGALSGENLAAHVAAADVFVFPSKTDTFGIVQLEALASGVPVAAFPVTGPKDVIGDAPVGMLDNDLRRACLAALEMSRQACRQHALQFSWTASATQFLDHVSCVATSAFRARQSGTRDEMRKRVQCSGPWAPSRERLEPNLKQLTTWTRPRSIAAVPQQVARRRVVVGTRRATLCASNWRR